MCFEFVTIGGTMKKILIPILILMFFIISCSSSKKTENNADILPDEDMISDDTQENPCKNIENSTGSIVEPIYTGQVGIECGCIENYFWDGEKCTSPCDPNPCAKMKNSTEKCTPKNIDEYSCGCIENYLWNGEICTTNPCYPDPCRGIENSTEECIVKNPDEYSCGCVESYFWTGEKCVNPCIPNPCAGMENSTEKCIADADQYSCECVKGFYWIGLKCVNPCIPDPCAGMENSTEKCIAYIDENRYLCECLEGYLWNGLKCVNPCIPNPCIGLANSTEECTTKNAEKYSCGCVEGYLWNGKSCVDPCEGIACSQLDHASGTCEPKDAFSFVCDCDEWYFWDGEKCVDPCNGISCSQFDHASGACKPKDAFSFSCDCVEGYWWWGKEKGCIAKKPTAVTVCTGQTKCYDNEKGIPCPAEGEDFFGQDANYARLGYCAPQNFSINNSVANEPVVVDNNLGLMWQRNKIPPVKELYIEDVLQYCEDLVYGGYDDWRLPTEAEFMTIADYGRYAPAVDTEYFPDFGSFWTSSKIVHYVPFESSDSEVHKIFDSAEPSAYPIITRDHNEFKAYSFNIRCIRGNNVSNPGYYFMPKTFGENAMLSDGNLIVMKKEDADYSWNEAMQYCQELDYAGISDWKLPNIKEFILSAKTGFNDNKRARTSTTKFFDSVSDFSYFDYSPYYTTSHLYTKEDKIKSNIFCVANDPCGKGKFWNGKKCVKNPCDPNPCESGDPLNKICKVLDENKYICGCNGCFNNPNYGDGYCSEHIMFGSTCKFEQG